MPHTVKPGWVMGHHKLRVIAPSAAEPPSRRVSPIALTAEHGSGDNSLRSGSNVFELRR
jgi:hypothetical protein